MLYHDESNAFMRVFNPLENLVAVQLYKCYGEDLFYYNKNVEIDFCVPKEGLLIQVSYRMVDEATRIRELGALQMVGKFLKSKKCMIVTYDQEEMIPSEELGFDIEVVPIYKFLLERYGALG